MKESKVLRYLNQEEIYDLKKELENNNNLWGKHDPPSALEEGKTIYIQQYSDTLKYIKSQWELFPNTYNILKKISLERKIGRVYWHCLLPNKKIKPHNDSSVLFVKQGKLLHRYQIYLNIDPKMKIYVDNNIADNSVLEYSILDFNLNNMHYYINNSDFSFFILVFDIIKS